MRVSAAKKLLFAPLFMIFFFALFAAEKRFQDPSPSPSPSPSPTSSPSPSPQPTATPTPLPGAQNFHQWGSITVFNGLPSDSVRAIAQTNDGVMWFGTDNGLARFDGRRIQNFSLGDSDGSKSILALETSASGDLWIGTRAGAFVHSGDEFLLVQGTQGVAINAILQRGADIFRPDTGLDVVFGTDRGLVLVARKNETGSFTSKPLFSNPILATDGTPATISGMIRTDHGGIIASTSGSGVFFVDDGVAKTEASLPVRSPLVNAIVRDSNSMVWLGTDAVRGASGIVAGDPNEMPVRIPAPTSKVLSLEANDSGVWAGSERFGLFHFVDTKLKKNYTFENTSGGLRSNTVFTLFTDREGVLWIGTNRGVSRFDQTGALQETVSDIPNSNFIRTLAVTYDDVRPGVNLLRFPPTKERLFAGSNRGLFTSTDDNQWTEVSALKDKVIYSLTTHGMYGPLLVGTSQGLYTVSGRKLLDGDVRGFATFNMRTFAAVYGRGVTDITALVEGTGTSTKLIFSDETVTSVCNRGDKLWIGTNGHGLFSYNGVGITNEARPENLRTGAIWGLHQTVSEGRLQGPLYIGGQHGVYKFDYGQVEQLVNVEDARDVFVTGDDVWAASATTGIVHIRLDERFGPISSSLGFEQGLPSDKAFAILHRYHVLRIATNRGIVTYTPGTVAPKVIATRVISQRVHDLTELGSQIDLEYPQNSLLVEVAGQSSRTFPEEFQYAFVLTNSKGEEVARQLSNDPQYAPSELKPGDYTIEAIAFNRDLLPSEPLFINFSVAKAPFPWTATALGVLLAVAMVGLVWAIVEHRRIAQRNRELAAARFDLANEAERERRRIARDLHDQTLADLRNLMLLSDKISPDKPEFRAEIESVSSEIRRICEDLSPSVLENVGLIASLEFLLKRTIDKSEFRAEENLEDRIALPMNAQLQVYRIAQEVLTNIKKHSSADRVDMSVSISGDKKLVLSITDNGKPFDHNGKNSAGRGIANIRARASLIKARVDWSAKDGKGNRFSLEVDA